METAWAMGAIDLGFQILPCGPRSGVTLYMFPKVSGPQFPPQSGVVRKSISCSPARMLFFFYARPPLELTPFFCPHGWHLQCLKNKRRQKQLKFGTRKNGESKGEP